MNRGYLPVPILKEVNALLMISSSSFVLDWGVNFITS